MKIKYDKEMVEKYYEMMKEYDNEYVLNLFCKKIPSNLTVLELGFGTGKDYLYLKEKYNITASDYSIDFINKFNNLHDDKILRINAIKMDISAKFDCIYSSKVLNSLNEDDIILSLKNQYDILNEGGYIFHTLWYGDKQEDDSYIDKDFLIKILKLKYEYIEFHFYKEETFNNAKYDSVIISGRKL